MDSIYGLVKQCLAAKTFPKIWWNEKQLHAVYAKNRVLNCNPQKVTV